MRNTHRKAIARVSALVLILALVLSFSASLAEATFKSTGAGVKYNGSTIKLGAYTTSAKLKKAFGSWSSRKTDNGCTCGYATYLYTFKSRGIVVETLQKKKGDKNEKIITITVTKSTVPTIAGLKVGNKTSVLAKKYGTKCSRSGSKVLYKSGKYYMKIYTKTKNGSRVITKIEFILDL